LFTERFKAFFRGDRASAPDTPPAAGVRTAVASVPKRKNISGMENYTRASNGLDQFFYALRDTFGLSILDMSSATQANITFIPGLGHRIFAEDLLSCVDQTYPEEDFFQAQADAVKSHEVLNQCLNFPEGHFDGALVWDNFQYLAPPLLTDVVDRMYHVLRPNAYLLAYFSAEERSAMVQHHDYRISDARHLLLTPRSERPPAQFFSTRSLEKLFSRYQQIKFFLTRDSLREVLVKR
jgi:hypothetical protein